MFKIPNRLTIYNTLTRQKEKFQPLKKSRVSFYQCGPTVYWTQHLGNLRAMVLADLMVRSLDYLGYQVKFVRNYTDVGHLMSDNDEGEDKLTKSARCEHKTPSEIADKYIKIFETDTRALNILEPWKKPRATKYIKAMAQLVQILIDKGYAYATDLAIYFDVSKAKDYTRLSGQDLSKNITDAGQGEVSDPQKKSPLDFAVWFFKAGSHQNALQTWKIKFKNISQPIAEGFPGWHLECSAMSQKLLGKTIDLHLGGLEHIPVHHTNEIAQSEAASGKTFVNYWLHNEHLTVDGKKMSKSGGTAYSLADIKNKGYDPLVLRYFFLGSHYRSKQNFTWQALAAAKIASDNLRSRLLSFRPSSAGAPAGRVEKSLKQKFISSLADDFNIPQALAIVWEVLKSNLAVADKYATIIDFDSVLGLDLANWQIKKAEIPEEIKNLAAQRWEARKEKNWAKSDRLRHELAELGWQLEDGKDDYQLKKN